jgi:MYXO-CTERM domain-containing protein
MQNSVTGLGGQNPHWNTELGLVKIMDPISSLTVRFSQLSGDGVGLNIASVVPTPGAAALAGIASLAGLRRRRR